MYTLEIDSDGERAIAFVGCRYAWSAELITLGYDTQGQHTIPEHHAWILSEGFESDTLGGHTPFPMLSPESTLYHSLQTLWERIV